MSWQPRQVYWAMVLSLIIGVGSTYAITTQEHKKDLGHAEQQSLQARNKLLARVVQLEGEVSSLRRDNDDLNNRLAQAAERDRARQVRASRSRRATASPVLAWTHSRHGIQIANCESADLQHWPWSDGSAYLGGEKGIHLRDPNGHFGKWQFALSTWRSVGGTGNPADASEAEQDMRAERLHDETEARHPGTGESPWSCSRMV